MTVESNHVIALVFVFVLVAFLIASKKWGVTSLQIRTKQVIGFGLSSTSSGLVKVSMVLVQVYVIPSCFQSN